MAIKISRYLARARKMPPRRVLREGFRLVGRGLSGYIQEGAVPLRLVSDGKRALRRALHPSVTPTALPTHVRATLEERFPIRPADRCALLGSLAEVAPHAEATILQEADQICDHTFDLLGSGPVSMGDRLDWHTDFKSGYRWNPTVYWRRLSPAGYPGGHDIKVPWELSRCQHFVRLGQAYWLTEDARYAREYVSQTRSWIEQNPWPLGVNWVCPMDVAIRAVNWLWGLAFFLDAPEAGDEFVATVARSLLTHGRHVAANLEGSPENSQTSNHYLSNLAGLVYLGICCPYFRDAEKWRETGWAELQREALKQVHEDGVDYEGSVPYHRLVVELLASSLLLGRRNGHDFEPPALQRLEHMLEFTMACTRPDGSVPIVGDADDGRLHRLSVWTDRQREWTDHRYLLALGSQLFGRADLAQAAGDQWQESLWLTGGAGPRSVSDPGEASAVAFPSGGYYILRGGGSHVTVRSGGAGTGGVGNHTHADALSVDLFCHGMPLLVDPGSYTYTSDYRERHAFRRGAAHNAVIIDGVEAYSLDPERPFLTETAPVTKVTSWQDGSSATLFEGSYQASNSVVYTRRIELSKGCGDVEITDSFAGSGEHRLSWNLQLDFDAECQLAEGPVPGVRVRRGNVVVVIAVSRQGASSEEWLQARLEPGWVSPSYGVRRRATRLHYTCLARFPLQVRLCASADRAP